MTIMRRVAVPLRYSPRIPPAGHHILTTARSGSTPEGLRLRRGSSEDPAPGPGRSLLLTGGITWQT